MGFLVGRKHGWSLQYYVLALFLLCPFFVVYSQTIPRSSSDNDWVSIEGPQLDRNNWERLRTMMASTVSADQEMALGSLEDSIRNGGTTSRDPNVVPLLAQVCLVPLQTQRAPGTGVNPDYPINRIRALKLAGLLGGARSAAMLWTVLKFEIEPAALIEAWRSLRQLKQQPGEAQILLLTRHLSDPFPNAPNDALMQELLATVKAFQVEWNCMARKEIFDPILTLSQNSRYLSATRAMAMQVLKTLMNLN